MTVTFMADQRGLGEDLYYCKDTGDVYIRKARNDAHLQLQGR